MRKQAKLHFKARHLLGATRNTKKKTTSHLWGGFGNKKYKDNEESSLYMCSVEVANIVNKKKDNELCSMSLGRH